MFLRVKNRSQVSDNVNPCQSVCKNMHIRNLFFSLFHSPAERLVLGCQLGPACTSQKRGRHSQRAFRLSTQSLLTRFTADKYSRERDRREKKENTQKGLDKVIHRAWYRREREQKREQFTNFSNQGNIHTQCLIYILYVLEIIIII